MKSLMDERKVHHGTACAIEDRAVQSKEIVK